MNKKSAMEFSLQLGPGVTVDVITQRLLEHIARVERRMNRKPRMRRALRRQAEFKAKGGD